MKRIRDGRGVTINRMVKSLGIRSAICLFAILAASLSALAQATDVYITPDGSAQGACTSNPQTPSFFNNSSNWGSGASQIGPGTTVHLCGTFTGTAGQQLLLFQGSGTSGNPITLLFDTGTNLTAPYWNRAITISRQHWITVDGGTNGIIQNTANGTGLTYAQPSSGVTILNSSNIIIKNLTVINICQHTLKSDLTGCEQNGNGDGGISMGGGLTNIIVTNNLIHDTKVGVFYGSSAGDSNITISNNTISRTNWAIGVGPSGISNGLLITGNDISCVVGAVCNWDTNDGQAFHHNGVMIYPINSGDQVEGVTISNNFIHDLNGQVTAGIFLDPSNGDIPGVQIYNNVFNTTNGQSGPANAWITVGVGVTGALVINNTIAGYASQGISGRSSPTFRNNIVSSVSCGEFLNNGYSGVASDYNNFYNLLGSTLSFYAGGSGFATIAAWTSAMGFDVHSRSGNPNLTGSFTLGSGSAAIGKGANLTSLGITGLQTGAPQSFGVNYACGNGCIARPTSGAWDMGAYQTSGSSSSQPNSPTGLTAQVQ